MHFCVLVILPEDITEKFVFPGKINQNVCKNINFTLSNKVEELMEPYSEHLEVDEQEAECYCRGCKAREDVIKKYENKIDGLKLLIDELPRDLRIAKNKEVLEPIYKKIDEEIKEHPFYDKIDPDCSECKGTGTYTYMINLNGWWDWWVIGGRWDGWINENNPITLSEEFKEFEYYNNVRMIKNIPKENKFVPYIIVVDYCYYYEVDEKEAFELFETFKDRVGITVDCHS